MKRDYKRPDGTWTNGYIDDNGLDEHGDYIDPLNRGQTDEDKRYEQKMAQERAKTARATVDGINDIFSEAWKIGSAPHIRLLKDAGRSFKSGIIPVLIISAIIIVVSIVLSSVYSFVINNQLLFVFVGLAIFGYFGYKRHKITEYKKNHSNHNRY